MRRPLARRTLTRSLAIVVVLAAACTDQRRSSPTAPSLSQLSPPGALLDSELGAVGPAAAGPLASLSINPSVFKGGQTTQVVVTLELPAPAGGLHVALASDDTAATVPDSITIAGGGTRGTFAIATREVSSDVRIGITASAGGGNLTALMRLTPLNALAGLTVDPAIQRGGDSIAGTVTLVSPAPAGGTVVRLESEQDDAIVAASITIEGGTRSGTFTIQTRGVSQPTEARINASVEGGRLSVMVRIVPGRVLSSNGSVTIGGQAD